MSVVKLNQLNEKSNLFLENYISIDLCEYLHGTESIDTFWFVKSLRKNNLTFRYFLKFKI